MERYSIEPRIRKYVKGCGFLSFARNVSTRKFYLLFDPATKTRLNDVKPV